MKLVVESEQLPQEWRYKKISDLCDLISGHHIKAKDYNSEGFGIGYLTGSSDFGIVNPIISKWTDHPKKIAKQGDILITVKGSGVGKINILSVPEVAIGRQLMAIRSTSVEREFLYKFLKIKFYFFQKIGNGAAIPGLSRKDILNIRVPIPPLPEQKRIVAILDEAFEGIDRAIRNTEKNLTNAREIFDSYLNTVFTHYRNNWQRVCVFDVCESIIDCINKTAPKIEEPSPFIMIRTTNIRNGKINLEDVRYVTEETYVKWTRRQVPKKGDVLLTREAPMGEVGIIESDDFIFLGQCIVSYRVDPKRINNEFLLYAFRSKDVQDQISAFASGSTVQHMRVPETK
ncbi:restriction endonuclease subunit S [Lusitaniella coriacea LEGE 07157]|uniref:Restriction endonuclease subunit S n=1 Tax=Lusitaniella coriacea LEGE 07157 TaxID=945747 RepID=A0A8J7JB62_9CYAN|nr:restriction endonuclease subunit S [Lusitaniella coriacea]MBE9116685.1 restriction endonuclease subunit S [Lusitaniella coriacea LEGE 07157]